LFEKAYDLARRHEDLIEGTPGANRFVSAAVQERLGQLDLIVDMIATRQKEFSSSFKAVGTPELTDDDAHRIVRLKDEIKLLIDAFYYFANSITTILETTPLPQLERSDPGKIGFVRNRLLEHFRPDPSAPYARASSIGSGDPTFWKHGKDIGMQSSGGLFENAERFARLLEAQFAQAVAAAEKAGRGDSSPSEVER
jgi:hypothetical protein